MSTRRQNHQRGYKGEWVAAWWLRLKGWRIKEQRWRGRRGEVDIVARRGNMWAFVEVKVRRDFADGVWAVRPAQQKRIMGAAQEYAVRIPASDTMRFDVVVVVLWRRLWHIEDVFRVGEGGRPWH